MVIEILRQGGQPSPQVVGDLVGAGQVAKDPVEVDPPVMIYGRPIVDT